MLYVLLYVLLYSEAEIASPVERFVPARDISPILLRLLRNASGPPLGTAARNRPLLVSIRCPLLGDSGIRILGP